MKKPKQPKPGRRGTRTSKRAARGAEANILGHRIALGPNNAQAAYFAKAAGTARFAWNWALERSQTLHLAWLDDPDVPWPEEALLRRTLNHIKPHEFPWMYDVTKCAAQEAIRQFGVAQKNFVEHGRGRPRFRAKFADDRFTISNDQFKVEGNRVRIPKLGWVRMRESVRFAGRILSATISRTADRWYVSFNIETPDWSRRGEAENQGPVGMDLGIERLATLSTGEAVAAPNPLRRLTGRLRRLQRSLSRKRKGSANRAKARLRIARLHARIACIRRDCLHKLTTRLARAHEVIVIEDLNVKGMMGNRHLARAIADLGWYEFRRQLEYKVARFGGRLVVAGRFFPSSKTCSGCGHRLGELPLGVRAWDCPACGARHDRDINAAVNLANYSAVSSIAV